MTLVVLMALHLSSLLLWYTCNNSYSNTFMQVSMFVHMLIILMPTDLQFISDVFIMIDPCLCL